MSRRAKRSARWLCYSAVYLLGGIAMLWARGADPVCQAMAWMTVAGAAAGAREAWRELRIEEGTASQRSVL